MNQTREQLQKLYEEKKYLDALQLLETEIQVNPNDFQLLKSKISFLGILGKYEESIAVADCAILINSTDHELLHMKGVGLYHTKKYQEALDTFEQCLKLMPHFHRAIQKKISILLFLGRFDEAAKIYEESDLPAIDNEIPFNNLGFMYLKIGDLNNALEFLNKAKLFNRFQPMIYYNFAQIYLRNKMIAQFLKNILFYAFLMTLKFLGIGKILYKFTPSNNFQEKKEVFDGPGKLFKTDKHTQEAKAILKLLRSPNAMALCNDSWEWFAVNIPYDSIEQNTFKGDIDILLKRPRYFDTYDTGFTYRVFEVKITKVNKNGKIKSGIHRGHGKLRKLKVKLNLLKKFGCEQIFFLEIFVLERGYSQHNSFPSSEIQEEIKTKANIIKELGCGYVVFADEPSPSCDDETGGITYLPINVLNTTPVEMNEKFKKLVEGIDQFKQTVQFDSQPNMGFVGNIISYCPNCKKLTMLECRRFVDYHCFLCKKKIY